MASQDDYLALLTKKSEQRQDPANTNRLAGIFDKYSQDSTWNPSGDAYQRGDLMGLDQPAPRDEQRFGQYLGEAVIQDAASMNKIDELRVLGVEGFISKYGLGTQAKQLVSNFSSTLQDQSTRASSSELDSDLLGQARNEQLIGLLRGKKPVGLEKP